MSDDTKALVQRLREPIPWERTTRGDRPTYQLWENHTMMVDHQRDQAADTIERLERDRDALAERCEKLREALLDVAVEWHTASALRCRVCEQTWVPGSPERHAPGCLAAPKDAIAEKEGK